MVPEALFLLISASVWSLGLTLPVRSVKRDHRTDANKNTPSDHGLFISDQIVKANKGIPVILYQGDIKLLTSRSARICNTCAWDKSGQGLVIVPYVISSVYSETNRDLITSAMLEFETMSCVRFRVRNRESNYLNVDDGEGCWSYFGRIGGRQNVSLKQTSCMDYGLIQHEMMHALSFYHEHNRLDRDSYVKINWQYISPENKDQFKMDNGNTFNISYDYTSVMHYSSKTFVNTSGQVSIIPIPNPNVSIGQRTGLSSLDVKRINVLYNCNLCRTKLLGASGKFSSSDATATNTSDNCLWLLHAPSNLILLQFAKFVCLSKNCSAKINMYDGVTKNSPLLATVIAGQPLTVLVSSGTLVLLEYITNASTQSSFSGSYSTVMYGGTFTRDGGSVKSPNYPFSYPDNARGTYIIIAPPKKQVLLTFSEFDIESSSKCSNDSLRIIDGGNLKAPLLGVYCGTRSDLVITSSGPMVVLQFSSNSNTSGKGFKANFSFVSTR
ncbi:astacin-like metalloendopeptidase [Lithobates pipiens]